MPKENSIQKFLDLLSQFSTIKKIRSGKRSAYSIPSLLDGEIPNLDELKKLANPHKIRISNVDHSEIVLIY